MNETWMSRAGRLANGFAVLAVIGWTFYAALGKNVFGATPWPDTMVDYRLLYDYSRQIVSQRTYPDHHAYPPSGIILHYATAQFPFPVSAALYLALTISAALGCWWVLFRMLRLERRPGGAVLILLALVASNYYFLWDLTSQNCNLLFLLSVLLGAKYLAEGRPMGAGFWLALSVSLKLFSVFLIPYLLWRGERRAFAWALVFAAFFWALLPLLVFGPSGTIEVYGNWLEQLKTVSTNQAETSHPILISLYNSAAWLSDRGWPGSGLLVNSFRVLWLSLGLAAMAASRTRAKPPGDAFGILTDIGILLLAPIAVSPYLEPYHAVPFAIPSILLLDAASDSHQTTRLRWLALSLFAATLLLAAIPTPWGIRGVMVNFRLFAATAGAIAVAWIRLPESEGRRAMSTAKANGDTVAAMS
jgi:hypothetical protein